MNQLLIYALLDPTTEHVRYVGKSSRGLLEPRSYFKPSEKKKKRHVNKWVNFLKENPKILILENNIKDQDELNELEQFYISYFRSLGCRLTNHTLGGEGSVGYKHTEFAKEKIRQAAKNQIWTEDRKQKISKAQKGRKLDNKHNKILQDARENYFKQNKHPKWHNNANSEKYKEHLKSLALKANKKSVEKVSIKIIDENGNIYNSMAEASRKLNCSHAEVCNNVNGKNKSVKRHVFRRV